MTTPALDRLRAGYYNSRPKTDANPGGLASNGHATSFPAALEDIAQGVDEAVQVLDETTAELLAGANAALDAKVGAAQGALDDTIAARDVTTGARDQTQEKLEAAEAAALAAAGSAGQAAGFSANSTSELTIGTGEQTLDVGPGKRFGDVLFVSLKDTAAPTENWMHGPVVSYVGSMLTVLVTSTAGAGTKSSWKVANAGPQGPSMSSGPLTGAINEKAATVASHATTADIWGATGNVINFTGAATVTAFPAASQAGSGRQLICEAGITFVPSADLIVPGGLPYTASADDRVRVIAITTTRFLLSIDRADGKAVISPDVFGDAIGDIVLSANRQPNSLRCNGAKYLKASYPALAAALGNIFDNTPASGSFSTLGRGYMQGACTDPSGLFGHYAAKSVDHALIGNVSIYLQKSGSYGPALTTDILTSTDDQVLALATNTSFIVALCLNAATSDRYLRYASLDASGQMTGAWANVTPAGLTVYANGFGVINGLFWVSYSVGGSDTSLRIAHGANPAALTVSTPTGTGAANNISRGCLMFFDGAEYIWWSGSAQLFRGAALSALSRDAAITVPELPSNDLSGNGKQVRRPSYSRSGARCIFSQHAYNDTNPLYKVDGFGKTGQVTAFRAGNVSSWSYKSAAFAGEEVFCAFLASAYVFSRMDFSTNELIGPSSSSWSASGEMTLCGNLMIFGTSGPSYFAGASYDISTTFAVPNLPSPVGEHQIKAV